MAERKYRTTRLEINLDNLSNNIKEIKNFVGEDVSVAVVLKANAYGHGAIGVVDTFLENGADKLAVSTVEEGIELRKNGVSSSILLLNQVPLYQHYEIIKYNLTPNIFDIENAVALNETGKKLNRKVKIHISIDTGMNRLGFTPDEESIEKIEEIGKMEFIEIEGIFSHLARADEKDKSFNKKQYNSFNWVLSRLGDKGIEIPIKHIANSAGLLEDKLYHMDMVRAGLIAYGYYPSEYVDSSKLNLKPALELKTKISYIKNVPKNSGISYNHKYKTKRDSVIATVPVGYADGYLRYLSNKAYVNINNEKYPIVGNICMDQFMIDITDAKEKIEVGEDVTLIGYEEENSMEIGEIAEILETINYEIICMLGRRVPRVYLKSGKVVGVKDYLID